MKKTKRLLSLLLAILVSFGVLSGFAANVFAAGEQMTVYMVELPRSADPNKTGWGHPALSFMGGWSASAGDRQTVLCENSYEGKAVYCIEPGVGIHTGDTFNGFGETFWDNYPNLNPTISPRIVKTHIGRIMQYGWQGNASTSWDSRNAADADAVAGYTATQILIWETVVGERDSEFNKINANAYGKNNIIEYVQQNHPLRNLILNHYNQIEYSVKQHIMVPSFFNRNASSADTYELQWNGNNYSVTLADSNKVLNNFNFSSNTPGVSFSVAGNELTITCDTIPKGNINITAEKKSGQRCGIVVWSDGNIGGGKQDTTTYGATVTDPITAFVNVKVSYGSAKIVKTSEDGKIEGLSFTISGNGVSQNVKTNSRGEIQLDNLVPGVYTVTEQNYDKYEPQEVRRVTVVSGQISTVTFNNTLKRGELKVTKTSEDGLNEGVTFHLTGISLSGLAVDEYAVTDSSGAATFKDVLIGSGYTLSEVDTAIRYVIPDSQTANVEWNKVTNKSFENILKKWNLTVTKSDFETGTAQGNASLAGAVYGIYKGNQLIDKYTTDANGQFVTKYYVCGDDWSVCEISPSEGYLLNGTSYHVGAAPQLYTIEYNSTANDVLETVKKGKIALIKHCDNGSTQIETPEKGAEFEVFLKASGSYESAKKAERDILVCDENGFAETKDLPYGVYTVKQTKSWEGKELMPAFDVYIAEGGATYRYLINNATFEALIEIVKKDIETGRIIPAAGIGFKVKNTDTGEYITQHLNYPTPVDIDIYYTDSNGKLMMPEKLPFGNYEIIEHCTAYGYVLSSAPVSFKVDGSETVVTVEKHNIAQKGIINIRKSGEVFSSVTEFDGLYQPVYSVQGLAGAVYEVTAAEDVITLDGTLRYNKGDIVAVITTGEDGTAVTEPLYLGNFEIKEVKAPYGMVLSDEIHSVELSYAGQEVEITETADSFYNERQRVQIDLSKVLEQDETFGIGMNGEILSVQFGLFVAEDLTAADGSVIPADGLLEIISCNANGKAVFATDIPVDVKLYIQEISTDGHYILSDAKYPVEFTYNEQDTATVSISVNDGEEINNEIIRGSVIGKKIDEDGFTICGAVFGLFKADETEFTEETALLTAKSNEIGMFGFENVPYGNWVIREIKPATAFVLNETVYPVTISEQDEVVKIEIENRFIVGSVQITKVDGEYPEHRLVGAEFEVYVDVDGNKEFDAEIDKLVDEMTEIEDGVFRTESLRYGGYFLHEKIAPVGFLKDEGYYYFAITEDGETVTVENEAGVGFINQPITGELEITKKDISDGKLLSNVGFHIKNDKGDIVLEGFTDENGIAKFKLRYGKYYYQEFKALDGYQLDDREYPFEITEDGQIIKADMTNGKIPIHDIPQTGDNSHLGIWFNIGAVALGGIVASVIIYFKKKKDDNDQ